ncbi:hypothetical protein [Streptomyces sp. NPDC005336]
MSAQLSGVLTALPTPFDVNDQIDVPLLNKVIDRPVELRLLESALATLDA